MIRWTIFTILINIMLYTGLLAQDLPLVYDVENTGADCPVPYLPSFNELPNINALPDPFAWSDGRGRMENLSDWRYRRAEIKAMIEKYEIGIKPDRPDSITASYINDTLKVFVTENGETLTLTSRIVLPEGEGPFPAMIGMGGTSLPDTLLSNRGIVVIPFNFGQVMAWQQIRGSEPINKLYPDLTYMGAYSAWPWGVSRLIDGLELVKEDLNIDLAHLGVSGCSFAGKMAIFSGALDERIALTIGIESGGGGYTTWRYSEVITDNVETLGNTSHVWFIEDLFQFSDDVPKLPYDHHELMAMVAPRALFVTGNPGWTWLADESGYVGSNATQKVYDALGVPDRFGYSQIGGHNHCAIPEAQLPELGAFLDKFLLGIDAANTNVATSPYTTDLTPWITWDTPALANGASYFGRVSLVSPANLEADLDSSVTFTWQHLEEAQEYYFQLSTNPTFKTFTAADTTTDTVKTVNGLLKGKKYFWRIQVKNMEGELGPWSELFNFTTSIPIPDVPPVVSAAMIPNRSDYIELTWRPVEYAETYHINISRNTEFSPLVVPSVTTSDTVKTVGGLFEGKFFWRVQAKNLAGFGSWSNVADFTILLGPTDLALEKTAANEITLTWKDKSFFEDGYIIERRQEPDTFFTVIDSVQKNVKVYTDQEIEPKTYTYRVKAYKDSASSYYSNEASILITGIADENKIPEKYALSQNFPNPFNPTTKIQYALPSAGLTKINIYDLLGRKIKTLINRNVEAGYHKVDVDAGDLPSGIYFYRIQSGNFIETKKMILMK